MNHYCYLWNTGYVLYMHIQPVTIAYLHCGNPFRIAGSINEIITSSVGCTYVLYVRSFLYTLFATGKSIDFLEGVQFYLFITPPPHTKASKQTKFANYLYDNSY